MYQYSHINCIGKFIYYQIYRSIFLDLLNKIQIFIHLQLKIILHIMQYLTIHQSEKMF